MTDEEIRREVARMLVEGKSYNGICEALDIPPSAVARHKRALQQAASDELITDAKCIRLVEDMRLEALSSAHWALALTDVRAADLVLRVHAARAKLWGLADIPDNAKPSEIKSRLMQLIAGS